MKFVLFEFKKLLKQRRFIWISLILVAVVSYMFFQNEARKDELKYQATNDLEPYLIEVDEIFSPLYALRQSGEMTVHEELLYEINNQMATKLFQNQVAIYEEDWGAIPFHEQEFLQMVGEFLEAGGEFSLNGRELEAMIERNEAFVENELAYENEVHPISPHLMLMEGMLFAFSVIGLAILVFFFGDILTREKEQSTWLTMRTQPLTKAKVILSKYIALLLAACVFTLIVIIYSIVITYLIGPYTMEFAYPVMFTDGVNYVVLSVWSVMWRYLFIFLSLVLFVFSLVLFLSNWFKQTFILFVVVTLILVAGYLLTDGFSVLQTYVNPFQLLRIEALFQEIPQSLDWMYGGVSLLVSLMLLALSIYLPEKEFLFIKFKLEQKPFYQGNTLKINSPLLAVIRLETVKGLRKGSLLQGLFIFFAVVVAAYFQLSSEVAERVEKGSSYQLMEENIVQIEEFLEMTGWIELAQHLEEDYGDDEVGLQSDQTYLMITEQLDLYQTQKELIGAALEEWGTGRWEAYHDYQLFRSRMFNGEFGLASLLDGEIGHAMEARIPGTGSFSNESAVEEAKWMKAHNVQPIVSGDFIPHRHMTFQDTPEGEVQRQTFYANNERLDNSGLFTLYLLFERGYYYGVLALLLFLLGAGFAYERGKTKPINLLHTLPWQESSLYLGKTFYAYTAGVIGCLFVFIIVVLIPTIFNRFGDWYYPILHYNHRDAVSVEEYSNLIAEGYRYQFMPLGEYLLHNILLFGMLIIFIFSLSTVLSLVFKRIFTVLVATVLMLIGGYMLTFYVIGTGHHLSPLTYFNLAKVTNGELALDFNHPAINYVTGTMVLAISSAIIVVVGYVLVKIKQLYRERRLN